METIYIEEIKDITVLSGNTGAVVDEATDVDGSVIVGVVIYSDDLSANPSMIKAAIFGNQKELSKMQHISNYRSREASYRDGYKPVIPMESGKRVRFEVRADSAFTVDFKAQLILIKEKRQNC